MSGLWNKLTDILGWEPLEDDADQWIHESEDEEGLFSAEQERDNFDDELEQSRSFSSSDSVRDPRIVSLHERNEAKKLNMKLAVSEPVSFDEVQPIADKLKKNTGVVVNIEQMDRSQAKRVVDFLSGTVYALDGEMQKVSAQVVMFVPRETKVQLMDTDETKKKNSTRDPFGDEEYNWK